MPHGVPTGAELAQAAREFLEHEIMPATDGRLRFLTRVAVNVAGQLERELTLGAEHARAHRERLARLGVGDDHELCQVIRQRSLDERMDEIVACTFASVVEKLKVSNPRYLRPQDRSNGKTQTDK